MDSESKADKILIRGTNWIGDAVMTLPAIRAVRQTLPDAHITLLVKPWVSGIFKGNPDIDEIMLYGDEYKGIVGKLKLAWMIRKKKFETAILFQNAFDAALITWLARIPERIGYLRDMRGKLLTNAVPVDKYTEGHHQIHYYLDLVKSIGIKTEDTHPHIYISDIEREDASLLLKSTFSANNPSPVTHYPSPLVGINIRLGKEVAGKELCLPDRHDNFRIKWAGCYVWREIRDSHSK
jgi:ADP-heptose:LPS heptosyltransferase